MFMDWWKKLIQKLNKFIPQRRSAVLPEETSQEDSHEMAQVKTLQKRVRMQAITAVASIAALLVLVFAMTAAWYTNVAKTSDLMFQTEAWGFDEKNIIIGNTVPVAPGESGIVPLVVDNSANTDSVKVGVTVSKNEVPSNSDAAQLEELRKRIYFYADTAHTYEFEGEALAVDENGQATIAPQQETVSRVYLGSADTESYTYEILPGQKLSLSEDYYNDVPIKWMWTYDMLGYYFRGTVTADESGNGTVAVDEYIRPIEYDYAYAVFDTTVTMVDGVAQNGEDFGQLVSTGELSRNEFLAQISAADGYHGQINVNRSKRIAPAEGETMAHIYYPVEVDENGIGVWAYLCNKNEIEAGILFDNALGSAEEGISLIARVVFTAVNIPAAEREVDSATALEEALNAEDVDVVKLRSSLYLNEPVELTGEGEKIIDLNGYSLDYSSAEDMFVVQNGAALTVMNGALNAPAEQSVTAFSTGGAELVLSGVTATGFYRIIDNDESLNAEGVAPSTIRITNCNFETPNVSLMIRGSGLTADTTTKVIVEDSRIVSGYLAISGNGNAPNAGTEIVIINSTLEGTYGALYQPQQRSKTTIKDSNLSGYTGIVIKGGTATVIDSIITGTGEHNPAANAPSGFIDTGDGVYVEAVYGWSASVYIKGEKTTISSRYGYAVELYGEVNAGPGKIVVESGTIKMLAESKGSVNWNGIGTLELYGESQTAPIEAKYDLPVVVETP